MKCQQVFCEWRQWQAGVKPNRQRCNPVWDLPLVLVKNPQGRLLYRGALLPLPDLMGQRVWVGKGTQGFLEITLGFNSMALCLRPQGVPGSHQQWGIVWVGDLGRWWIHLMEVMNSPDGGDHKAAAWEEGLKLSVWEKDWTVRLQEFSSLDFIPCLALSAVRCDYWA